MKLPLSVVQGGLWYQIQSDCHASAAYNIVLAFRSTPDIDVDALRAAWRDACRRHPLLSARVIDVDGEACFEIGDAPLVDVEVVDGPIERIASVESAVSLDYATGPLHRVRVIRGDDDAPSGLVFTLSHLVCDGASVQILLSELARAYPDVGSREDLCDTDALQRMLRGRVPAPELVMEAARRLSSAARQPHPEFLSPGQQGPAGMYDAAASTLAVPAQTLARLRDWTRSRRTSVAAACLSAFSIVIWQYSGQGEFTIGVPTSSRREGDEHCVSYLTTLGIAPIAIHAHDDLSSHLERVSMALFDLVDAADIPLPLLMRALHEQASGAVLPRIGFNYQRLSIRHKLGPVELESVDFVPRYAKDLIALDAEEFDNGTMRLRLLYDRSTFDEATAARMLRQCIALLDRMLAESKAPLAQLPLLAPADREIGKPGEIGEAGTEALLQSLLAAAQRHGDHMAVVCGDERWTYAQLHRRARTLAAVLHAEGLRPDDLVAAVLPRGTWPVTCLLAVLMAGGAYVPLDAAAPAEHLLATLDRISPAFILALADEASLLALPVQMSCRRLDPRCVAVGSAVPGDDDANIDVPALPERIAYCIQTSGTTGTPKVVAIPVGALSRHVERCRSHYAVEPGDRVLQFSAAHLDPFIEQALVALTSGATLHLRGEETWGLDELLGEIRHHQITVADIPTAYWHLWANRAFEQAAELPLRLVIVGGEAAAATSVPPAGLPFRCINAYGPTEATITATTWEMSTRVGTGWTQLPIGTPLEGTSVYLLNDALEPVPPGVRGEIFLAGSTLARGYVGHPGMTASRFLPDPFAGAGSRMYRTGDIGVWSPQQGGIQFIGRIDRQLKLRGFRVELPDVEHAIRQLPGVLEAVAIAKADAAGISRELVAYVVAPGVAVEDLKPALAARLPAHMVPATWYRLHAIPLGANGKVDVAALAVAGVPLVSTPDNESPKPSRALTPTEQAVEAIWAEVLGMASPSPDDNFFALGGHSLLATQIVARLTKQLDRPVTLRTLLDAPTIASLAAKLDAMEKTMAPRGPTLQSRQRTHSKPERA